MASEAIQPIWLPSPANSILLISIYLYLQAISVYIYLQAISACIYLQAISVYIPTGYICMYIPTDKCVYMIHAISTS